MPPPHTAAVNRFSGENGRINLPASSRMKAIFIRVVFNLITSPHLESKQLFSLVMSDTAKELKGTGITANCVAPGPIATEMFFEGKSSEVVEKIAAENPFGRVGEVKDVVPLVGFLASDGGEWINGQINGGYF
ncbi:hypothetical protein Bca4012_069297 [Brassica carinata]|uniref:Uncharacterized protein n=1 Tax=Brassica carinata TaxID=52824 RepID=A0A8X7P461_BRACI|nr:hypothetical protein Bca52824_094282 [Brassica carinata]